MNHEGEDRDYRAEEASGSRLDAREGRAPHTGQWGGGELTLPRGLRAWEGRGRSVGGAARGPPPPRNLLGWVNARPRPLSPVSLGATRGRSRCVSPSVGREVTGRPFPHTILAALGLQESEAGLRLSSDVHFKHIITLPHCPTLNSNVTSYSDDQARVRAYFRGPEGWSGCLWHLLSRQTEAARKVLQISLLHPG